MFGGVSRRVQGGGGDVSQGDGGLVKEAFGFEFVLPVRPALARNVDCRTGGGGKFAGPGEVVGVDVGLGDGGDLHAVFRCKVLVHLDVAAGVHHEGLALGLAADEVAGLREVFVVNTFQKHVSPC
ncbi:hypothetical protein B879_04249 [Cecembia lonarensis LW9]|uniref:Uncharacterized protein n=1 Tax=Cecembia lonarensis (strain CCUG 58316 / KCTC 22772 / LW9) TaxID=1225176 RepID=K1L9S8_CECL9|nr:hypothetical protein B879_04249 [Cecembia lonarensis LW9]